MNFKKNVLVAALIVVAGSTYADINYRWTTDPVLGNYYLQTNGENTYQISTDGLISVSRNKSDSLYSNDVIASTTKVKDVQSSAQGQNYQQYKYDETRRANLNDSYNYSSNQVATNEATHYERVYDNSTSTGSLTRQANTKVQLDSLGREILGTEQRVTDSSFIFNPDDLTKVKNASISSNYNYQSNIRYAADQALDTIDIYKNKYSNYNSIQKMDASGQPVLENGQSVFIANGQDTQNQTISTVYKTMQNPEGKEVSLDTGHVVNSRNESSDRNSTSVDYARDGNGQVVGISLSADKKYFGNESTIATEHSQSSSSQTNYDDLAVVKQKGASQYNNTTEKVSVWDGFIYKQRSSSESSNTKYQDGVAPLGSEQTRKTSQSSTDRVFKKDSNNILILDANNQPQVAYSIMSNTAEEAYQSDYQPSHYVAGNQQGQDFVILNNGQNSRSTDLATQKNQFKATSSEIKNYDDGFVATANSTIQTKAEYQRSLQENIEVNRQLERQLDFDSKQLTSRTVSGVSPNVAPETEAGSVNTTINNQSYIGLGNTVQPGQYVAESQVRSWVDEQGTQRYYVVLGKDLNGNDIRSEVSLQNTVKANNSVQIDTVTSTKRNENTQEKVQLGQDLAYQYTGNETSTNSETSKDGSVIYQNSNVDNERSIKLYSAGKNALDREAQQSSKYSTLDTDLSLNEQGNVTIKNTRISDSSEQSAIQQYQVGQEKHWNFSSQQTRTDKSHDSNGQLQYLNESANQKNITQYAKDKNALDRTYSSSASQVTQNNVLLNLTSPYYGVDENGISLSKRDGVLAIDETGREVKSIQNVKKTESNVISQRTSNQKIDEKVYQSGAVAYQKSEQFNQSQQDKYSNGYVAQVTNQFDNDVILYNHGLSDKYREATTIQKESANSQLTEFNPSGEQVVAGTLQGSITTKNSVVDYQLGKNALLSSETITVDSSTQKNTPTVVEDNTLSLVTDSRIYQADQKIANENSTSSIGVTKVTNADQTGYTYSTSTNSNVTTNNTGKGLLATQQIYSNEKVETNESLKSNTNGKAIDTTIVRGSETVNKSDFSQDIKTYGSEIIKNADGSSISTSKQAIAVQDKFGLNVSSSVLQETTDVSKEGNVGKVSNIREDNTSGLILTQDKSNKLANGQEVKSSATTTIKAGEVATGNVKLTDQGINAGNYVISNVAAGTAQTDAVNVGQLKDTYSATLSSSKAYTDSWAAKVNDRLNENEQNAYRGIAISLAAQQPVPNMRPGQVAVFGGMGHYEGQSAGALGVTSVLEDGRTSFSGAFGVAGGGEVGGRVGVSYVFGGK